MRKIKRRSDCPIGFGLDFFGDKWTLLIIRDMIFMKKSSYGDFLKSDEGISTNILADRLAFLEQEKIVNKKVDPSHKSKFVYSLTQKGFDLLPIVVEMMLWSYKYDKKTPLTADFVAVITSDKEAFIQSMVDNADSKR